MGKDFIGKMTKMEMVVWDSKMIAMKPEKKIWGAEIEIYRFVMSNGPYGYEKNAKKVSMFLDFGPAYRHHVVDYHIFDILSARMALKKWKSFWKIIFCQIFIRTFVSLTLTMFHSCIKCCVFRFCLEKVLEKASFVFCHCMLILTLFMQKLTLCPY